MTRVLCSIVAISALASALPARADDPPPGPDLCPQGEVGCYERCLLADTTETPSPFFLEKLGSIAPTKHHIDTVYGAQHATRLPGLGIVNVGGVSPEAAARWSQNRRYAGPCTKLVAVFHSKAVENADDKNVVDLYELRYPDAEAARRIQTLLTFPARGNWDWNYHPFSAAYHDRSVFVIEGRWRAWSAFRAVAAHFGAPIINKHRPAVLPPCGPTPEGKPLLAIAGHDGNPALSVFALGFSPTGRLAWLEQRVRPGDRDVEWSIQVVDLINDRALPGKSFHVARGVNAMCAQHGAEVGDLLQESAISASVDLALEQPTPGKDPTGVALRPAPAGGGTSLGAIDVVLRGLPGEKKIGVLPQPGGGTAPTVIGFLRSPFEPRVAVAVVQPRDADRRGPAIRFFGCRLDKRWTPPPASSQPGAARQPAAGQR